MKRFRSVVSILILAALLFVSCASGNVRLTYDEGKLINKSKRLSYAAAPLNYEPAAIGEEYAVYGKTETPLYEIIGLDPKEWLTEANTGSTTTVFYGSSVTLPTLREMDPDEVFVCVNGAITYALSTVRDKEAIDAMIGLFENGEQADWPLTDSVRIYELKFHSAENWPYIYYNLTFGEFPEGKFLYDRQTKRCVEIGEILDNAVAG
ncbi:MAG: hypothetical protein E7576_01775 [Ruminococcaceae bacterium]|jgi:hypothetical protein|nr:hypothetical protein [Oscillospiraceae bacterium]